MSENMESIIDYLDEIDELLETSKVAPFSNKIAVDKGELRDLIEEIRLNLPAEIEHAKRLVNDHERVMDDARHKASDIKRNAEADADRLSDEHEITRRAEEKARAIETAARNNAKMMRQSALEYADEILTKVEESVREAMSLMNRTSGQINEMFDDNLGIISQNRAELRADIGDNPRKG
ncbi:hypothetical protein AGMMS49975_05570 [Clostridia bacterium]|nr:hypothetical protein AGMMS49975_05570 [Clostridia bacterium]